MTASFSDGEVAVSTRVTPKRNGRGYLDAWCLLVDRQAEVPTVCSQGGSNPRANSEKNHHQAFRRRSVDDVARGGLESATFVSTKSTRSFPK